MTQNVGGIDRILRIVVGLVLVGLAATGTVGWWGWLAWCCWEPAPSAGAHPTPSWASTPARPRTRPESRTGRRGGTAALPAGRV